MRDGFKNYDRWKLASPEDEAEALRCRIADREADRADEMRDRERDEKYDRPQTPEPKEDDCNE